MKKVFVFLLLCSAFSVSSIDAQDVRMTFTAGVSPQQNPVTHHIIVNRLSPADEFIFDIAQVKATYYIGVGAKYDFKPFFLAADALYNRREYLYNVSFTYPGFGRTEAIQVMTENMNVINFPLTIGVDLGIVDVMSGFLPQVIVSQDSDLSGLVGYSQKLDRLRFGWHSGFAVNIQELRVGLSWQMDFNNYADHVYIRDQNLTLQGRPSRFLGSLTYLF